MKKTVPTIHFAGSQLDETRHVCAFFNNEEEDYRVLLPFIKDGFECGDKAIHVVNPNQPTYHLPQFGGDTVHAADNTANPFFVPPEDFLPELRERRARQKARSTAV